MKKAIIILAICLLAPSLTMAANVGIEMYRLFPNSTGEEYSVERHRGIKIAAAFGKSALQPRLWGSLDQIDTRLVGLAGPEYEIYGIGVGLQYKISKYLEIFGDVGYFQPTQSNLKSVRVTYIDKKGRKRKYQDRLGAAEGVNHYLNNRYNGTLPWAPVGGVFDEVSVESKGDFGGEVGFRFEYPVLDWCALNIIGAYRMMAITETIRGDRDDWKGWWEHRTSRNFSGARIGVGFTIKF